MSASTVYVTNISSKTSEKEVKDFFSFCGKIASIEITPTGETQKATVTFEKETAAKTALLLDNTALGSTQVKVTSASGSSTDDDGSHYTSNDNRDSDEITQEEKPRSRIVAEYLAHGYAIGDTAVQRAIDLDTKHNVSNRFLQTLSNLDAKYHATDKAKSVDQSYGVTQKTSSLLSGISSYFVKATDTPTGQKLVNFYTQTSRQVQDIHAEARRLADLKKQESGAGGVSTVPGTEKTTCKCGSVAKDCPCAPGACACAGCEKSDVKKVAEGKTSCGCSGNTKVCGCAPGACTCSSCPKAEMKTVPGTDKTTCNCGGALKSCPCAPGKCACNSCPKSTMDLKPVAGTDKTVCNCGGSTEKCACEAGKCSCGSCPKADVKNVAGSEKTTCKCGGNDKNCPCEAGKCACSGCAK